MPVSNTELNELKDEFADDINSIRQYERIHTIDDLIQILDQRDLFYKTLGPDYDLSSITVEDLKRVSQILKTKTLKPLCLPEIVLEELSKAIGADWKQFADLWKIQVDSACDQKLCAKNLLLQYEKSCGRISSKELEFRLIRGFRKCQRTDLELLLLKLTQY